MGFRTFGLHGRDVFCLYIIVNQYFGCRMGRCGVVGEGDDAVVVAFGNVDVAIVDEAAHGVVVDEGVHAYAFV